MSRDPLTELCDWRIKPGCIRFKTRSLCEMGCGTTWRTRIRRSGLPTARGFHLIPLPHRGRGQGEGASRIDTVRERGETWAVDPEMRVSSLEDDRELRRPRRRR
jgi:hypothetical protein